MLKRLFWILTLLLTCVRGFGQISGTVYRDYNGDGQRQTLAPQAEPGVPGILVQAYNESNVLLASTTSAADGSYSLPFTVPVRVEFIIPAGLSCVSSALDVSSAGTDGNNVRFVSTSSTQHYALSFPGDYVSNTNPLVFMPRYIDGDPLGGGSSGTSNGFVAYNYTQSGTQAPVRTLQASALGSVWGVAYSKQAKKVFTSAFLKRQVGLGPLGSGGIYLLEPTASSFNVTTFYDMDANGYRTRAAAGAPAYGLGSSFDVNAAGTMATYLGSMDPASGAPSGLGVIGVNGVGGRNLPAAAGTDAHDPAAFDQVGKVGLGGLEISEDGKFLFVVNFYDRKLYRLELNNAYQPSSVIAVSSYALPPQAVTNGVLRPWALNYYRDKVYVGAVATGENGGVNTVGGATDLYAYVFELQNPTSSAVFQSTPVLTIPLNYQKGGAIMNNPAAAQWYPWNKVSDAVLNFSGEQTLPTPALSDIDFSDRGDMILAFSDRSGHQYGFSNFQNLTGSANMYSYDIGGDVLMAGRQCGDGSFVLENNGSYSSDGTTLTGGAGNGQGPGGGEFFYGDFYPGWHNETGMGSLAVLPGDQRVLLSVMDPVNDFSGGTARFSTSDGGRTGMLQVYANPEPGTFAKANGLGDIEMAGDVAPIEIGNRVWNDVNANGIQDIGESGIASVSIQLFADFNNDGIADGAALASTATNAEGMYTFHTGNVIDGDPNTAGNQAGPQSLKTYLLRIAASDWTAGSGAGDLSGYGLSLANIGGAGQPDVRDNDAVLIAGVPQIQFTTGQCGENNHRLDFGFKLCTADAGNDVTLTCSVPSATIGTPAIAGEVYSWAPSAGLNATTIAQPIATPLTTTVYILTVNGSCVDMVTVTVNKTAPTANAGAALNLNCNTTSGTIGTTAIAGNTYSWSPGTGLSSASIAQPIAGPNATTIYTVTVTGINGCTATSSVNVNVNTSTPSANAGAALNLNCNTTSGTIGTTAIAGNTYSWSPSIGLSSAAIAQPLANPNATTIYTVTVTGSNGCTATSSVNVNVNTSTPSANAGAALNLNCNTTSGTIGTTGIAGNIYSWSPSSGLSSASIAQPVASPNATTIYTVTVTSSNGCTATSSVNVNVNTSTPTANAGAALNLNCNTTSGTIGTTGIAGNIYNWSPSTGLSSATIAQPVASPNATTIYTVTVTGSNGCTATSSVNINVNTSTPSANAGTALNLNCNTTSGTIGTTAIAGNIYSWSPSSGLSSASIAQPVASPNGTTIYTVTVTGSNGCTATSSVTVSANFQVPVITGLTHDSICIGSSAMLTASGAPTITWTDPSSNSYVNLSVVSPTASTIYTITATNANGCSATSTKSVYIYALPLLSIQASQTELCQGGAALLSVSGAQTYAWSQGASSDSIWVFPQTTTIYSVTGTDAHCSNTATINMVVNPYTTLIPSSSSLAFHTQPDGSQLSYTDSLCNRLAFIADSAGGNQLGNTFVQVTVENSVAHVDSLIFAPRWYEITPTNNGSADLTLFFTQADFDSYNLNNQSSIDLPLSGNNQDPNILHARIWKISEGPNNTTITTQLSPNLFWNGNYWELSFHVDGFSKFYLYAALPNTALPARELAATLAYLQEPQQAVVNWYTMDEQNTAQFVVERSTNGTDFSEVGSLPAGMNTQGRTEYSISHELSSVPETGMLYYRIRLDDLDGKFYYSNTITLRRSSSDKEQVLVFPCPFSDHLLVDYQASEEGEVELSLFDWSGRALHTSNFDVQEGSQRFTIKELQVLPAGTYLLRVEELSSGSVFVQKVLKQ